MTPGGYRALLERLDAWAEGARQRHPGVIPCRAGCSACCLGPFDITVADVELLREAVARLPDGERAEVRRRAARQLSAMRAEAPGWGPPWDVRALGDERFDALSEARAAEPCPLLDDAGRCRAYADRPMVCRLIGLGLQLPDGQVLENCCPIQGEHPAYAALPPAPFDLPAFEAEEARAHGSAAMRLGLDPGFETTVAGAILLRDGTA